MKLAWGSELQNCIISLKLFNVNIVPIINNRVSNVENIYILHVYKHDGYALDIT